ncbi:MAG TPA: TonB family protein [Polyangia bacterium]
MQSNLKLSPPADATFDGEPTPAPVAPEWPSFSGFLQQGSETRRAIWRRRRTCVVSVGLHAGVLVGMALLATGAPMTRSSPSLAMAVPVTIGLRPPAPGPAATAVAKAPEPARAKPRTHPPRPRPIVAPSPVAAPAEPDPANEGDGPAEAPASPAAAPATTVVNGTGGGGPATSTGTGSAPALSPEAVKALQDRYIQEILRTRIAARLVYPIEAERMGAEGTVVVRVRVSSAGVVIHAAVMGACPHDVLCEDALRTVRAASPFPPPPPALGSLIDVSVPVAYRLE